MWKMEERSPWGFLHSKDDGVPCILWFVPILAKPTRPKPLFAKFGPTLQVGPCRGAPRLVRISSSASAVHTTKHPLPILATKEASLVTSPNTLGETQRLIAILEKVTSLQERKKMKNEEGMEHSCRQFHVDNL